MSAKENALAPDDYNENISGRISRHSEYSIEADLQTERDNILDEEDALELARRLERELAGSIVALWQQRLTQSSSFEGDIDIEYASESEPPTPVPELEDDSAVNNAPVHRNMSNAEDRLKGDNSAGVREDFNGNKRHPMAPVRLAMPDPTNGGNTNSALEEIRSRLRKTKFDYSSDSRHRISDATPSVPGTGDFRHVLKKKNNA